MRILFVALLAAMLPVLMLTNDTVQAHVLFIDNNTNVAAVFHSNPNDDPVAGEPSELFFDIQDQNSTVRIPYTGYELFITDETGNETKLTTTASGSSVKIDYTFPSQGLYLLSLRSQPKYDAFQKVVIDGSLRIERGAGVSSKVENKTPQILGLIASLTAAAVLSITFINNRAVILRYSRF